MTTIELSRLRYLRLILLLLLVISACTLKPPDVPVCENLSEHIAIDPSDDHVVMVPSPTCEKQIKEVECGHCVYVVSGKEIYVGEGATHLLNGKTWTRIKLESVYVPAVESYGPLSDYMINSCKKMNCDKQIDAFKIKLDSLSEGLLVPTAHPNLQSAP